MLVGVPVERNVVLYDCCPDNPYIDLTYSINVRRRKLYYLVNIVLPCVMLAVLTLLTFTIPCEAGEKISFSEYQILRYIEPYYPLLMTVSKELPFTKLKPFNISLFPYSNSWFVKTITCHKCYIVFKKVESLFGFSFKLIFLQISTSDI